MISLILVILVLGALSVLGFLRPAATKNTPSATDRLILRLRENPNLLVYVKLSDAQPWQKVTAYEDGKFRISKERTSPPQSLTSFVVAYANGEILEVHGPTGRLPEGLHFIKESSERVTDLETWTGKDSEYLKVEHRPSRLYPGARNRYETVLANISSKRLRILRFAAYNRTVDGKWKMNTVSGSFFSAIQFREWHGLGDSEWILPGQTVKDPDNYSGGNALWLYIGETDDGIPFRTGGVTKP